MVTQNKHRYLLPVIEDSVQLWNFVQLSRKYGGIIVSDPVLFDKFKSRVNTVKSKHMTLQREMDALDEIVEELEDKKGRSAAVVIKESNLSNAQMLDLQKKPFALLRSVHCLLIEMDARLKRIEEKFLNTEIN